MTHARGWKGDLLGGRRCEKVVRHFRVQSEPIKQALSQQIRFDR